MKFEVKQAAPFWEVGFCNPGGQWVCLRAFNTQAEADQECSRLIGGNS